MTHLAKQLEYIKYNKRLWIDQDFGDVYSNQITCATTSVDNANFVGKKVGLGRLSQLELAISMIFLDGVAESITLIPEEEITKSNKPDSWGVDFILDGNGIGFSSLLQNPKPENTEAPAIVSKCHTKWILSTSGTTGTPKQIVHDLQSLTRTVRNNRSRETLLWGSLYNMKRFAGLQVFLQSWMGGDELVLTDNLGNTKEIIANLIASGCNALSATPSMWRNVSMLPQFKSMNLKQISLGGEIVDQPVLDMLHREFPKARVTHIYASTEAGVGFAVNDGKAGFPVEYLSIPPKNNKLKIGDNGNLHILPASNINIEKLAEEAWIDSGDAVCVKADRVIFLGRSNGSINVGGNKVMPEEIESVIYELDSIAFVQIRARKNSIVGNLIEAAIIPAKGVNMDSTLKRLVIDHCRKNLVGYKTPAFVVEAETFILNSVGKLARGKVNE